MTLTFQVILSHGFDSPFNFRQDLTFHFHFVVSHSLTSSMGSTPVGVNCSAHSFPPNFSAPRLPAQCRQVRSSPFCYVIEPLFPRASFPVCPVHITPHHLFDHSALPHSAYMTKEFHFPLYNHLENIRFSLHSSSDFRVLDSLLPSYHVQRGSA